MRYVKQVFAMVTNRSSYQYRLIFGESCMGVYARTLSVVLNKTHVVLSKFDLDEVSRIKI